MGQMRIYARDIQFILEAVSGKKIILYGSTKRDSDLSKKLECLGLRIAYCVEDEGALTDTQFKEIMSTGMVVKNVCELLLEKEPYYVMIIKDDIKKCADLLDRLGLKVVSDYNRLFLGSDRLDVKVGYSLDPTMGHGQADYGERGIKIFGDIDTASYKIAISGGSTSDACAFPWKSWGELLYEKLKEQGYNVALIVGAVVGYSSSQELFKLIRDILPLKPDLIISYSGANDHDNRHPYLDLYQFELFQNLRQKSVYERDGAGKADCITWGVSQEISGIDKWIRNQRIMHNISMGEDCDYLGIYQPQLLTKKRGAKDEEIWFYVEKGLKDEYSRYLPQARSLIEKTDYLIDGSGWFDEIDGLFFDRHHVYEEGNRMIADKVYRIVKTFVEERDGISI